MSLHHRALQDSALGTLYRTEGRPLSVLRLAASRAFGFLLVAVLALLVSQTLLDSPAFHAMSLSSDSLFPAAFVWDVMHHSSAWKTFEHSRVPSIFPDLVIYGPLQALLGDWRIALALWTCIVMAWLFAVGGWIGAQIGGASFIRATQVFALLAATVLMTALLGYPNTTKGLDGTGYAYPYLFILVLATHGGPFLLALTIAAVACREALRPVPRATTLALLSLGAWANGVSDLLCVTTLLAPLCTALAAGWVVRSVSTRSLLVICAVVCISAMVGWAGSMVMNRQPLPPLSIAAIVYKTVWFLRGIRSYPGMILVSLCLLASLAMMVRRRGLRQTLAGLWPVFALVSAATSVTVTVFMHDDIWSFRYALPFLWWPLIIAAGLVAGTRALWTPLPTLATMAACSLLAWPYVEKGWHPPSILTWRTVSLTAFCPTACVPVSVTIGQRA